MANEAALPASYCETLGWIGGWPLGRAFDEWSGTATEQPSVAMFLAEFVEIVCHLGGRIDPPLGEISLEEAKRAARTRTRQLIVQNHEVPKGWEEAFKVSAPGIEPVTFLLERILYFPSRPIRTAHDVLEFMDEKGKQTSLNNVFTPTELRESAFRDAIKGAVLWLVDYGYAKPSTSDSELPNDVLELFKVFNAVRAKVGDISAREQRGWTPNKADTAVQTDAALLQSGIASPTNLAEFATWIDSILTELESREGDEPIGESGKAHMPLASPAGSPSVSVVTIYQPSRLYVIREQLLDGLEEFAPPNAVDELFDKFPPEKVKTLRRLRRLIVNCKSAVRKAIAESPASPRSDANSATISPPNPEETHHLTELQQGERTTEADAETLTPPSLKEPDKEAFAAYRVHKLLGKNQTETAEMLTREFCRPINQGQVSRWCAAVGKWVEAGGLMPSEPITKPTVCSVDPDVLDMGQRVDGRTPRQRERRDDE